MTASDVGNVILGVVLFLHGAVHLWYLVLAQRWVAFEASMGWTGRSWALTAPLGDGTTRAFASATFLLVAAAFALGGVAVAIGFRWTEPLLVLAAVLSLAAIGLFWDGKPDMLVQKGLIGAAIDLAVVLWVALT